MAAVTTPAATLDVPQPGDQDDPRCLDPAWTQSDADLCRERWSETQCLILEGAHLDAQNMAEWVEFYAKTDYLDGVKQQETLSKWGDIDPDKGVCTDTVIRAMRRAGIDLQWLVHLDMLADQKKPDGKKLYPWGKWKKKKADANIDHRRAPILARFLELHGESLTTGTATGDIGAWQPGDVVYWDLGTGRFHVGVVTDSIGESGLPRVVHNYPDPGYSCEEDALERFEIVGHYRYPAAGEPVPVVPQP